MLSEPSTGFLTMIYSIFQTDLLSAGVFTLHCLERTEEAARWLFNQVSNSLLSDGGGGQSGRRR